MNIITQQFTELQYQWYCSVQNGLKYAETWDTTGREDSMAGFVEAMDYFNNA